MEKNMTANTTNTNTTNTTPAPVQLTRKVTVTKDAAALAALLATSSPLVILSSAMTVPATETVDMVDNEGKVVSTTTRRKAVPVTLDDCGIDRKEATRAVQAIVKRNEQGVKDMGKLFGLDVNDDDIANAMRMIDKNFRTSCKGIKGIMPRNKLVTLDSVIPVIRRIQTGDWQVDVWESEADYKKASGDRPVPVLSFKVNARKQGKA